MKETSIISASFSGVRLSSSCCSSCGDDDCVVVGWEWSWWKDLV